MKIYVAAHKKVDWFPADEIYSPMQVGAALHDRLPYQGDDEGENISEKNPNFCELTAYYWIWKHSKEDVVGLAHYRRYFTTYGGYLAKLFTGRNVGFLDEKTINSDLKEHDVIVSTKAICTNRGKDIYSAYSRSHKEKDMKLFLEILHRLYPEYDEAAKKVMSETIFYPANMMICRKELFDDYSNWLFSIFSEMEKTIDISDYDAYQSRIYGFLSERVFRIWLVHNNLRLKERHIINTEDRSIWGMAINYLKTGRIR